MNLLISCILYHNKFSFMFCRSPAAVTNYVTGDKWSPCRTRSLSLYWCTVRNDFPLAHIYIINIITYVCHDKAMLTLLNLLDISISCEQQKRILKPIVTNWPALNQRRYCCWYRVQFCIESLFPVACYKQASGGMLYMHVAFGEQAYAYWLKDNINVLDHQKWHKIA